MKLVLGACILLLLATPAGALQHHLLIISGIGGTKDYRQQFVRVSEGMVQSAIEAGLDDSNIMLLSAESLVESPVSQGRSDKANIARELQQISTRASTEDRIFVILIGHGNPRGESAA